MVAADRLVPPCGYTGGKRRFAPQIVDRLLPAGSEFVDVGAGSGAVTLELLNRGVAPSRLTMIEAGPWGLFWREVGEGTLDLGKIREAFTYVDQAPPGDVAAWVEGEVTTWGLTAPAFLVLQAAAFGSTPVWWDGGGWRRGERHVIRRYKARGYWEPGPASKETKPRGTIFTPRKIIDLVERIARYARGVQVYYGDVASTSFVPGAVIYIDPPYGNTSGYGSTMDLPALLARRVGPTFVSESYPLPAAQMSWRLGGRKGAALNGKGVREEPTRTEWLSAFD